jgi:hypothetical protein
LFGQNAEVRAKPLATPRNKPAGEEEEGAILDEFVPDDYLSAAAAAVELDHVKGHAPGRSNCQSPPKNDQGKGDQHQHQHEGGTADRHPDYQQEPAKYFKPGQSGGNGIQQEWIGDHFILAH